MASRHKPKLSLAAIPPFTTAINQSPRTTVHNADSAPLPPKAMLTSQKPAEEGLSSIDPDDLFVRFTIPEIRNIQLNLRADADAKQEELRVMVGERYRDLLQASTSIISIANSSRHVMEALAEMREAMTPDEHQRKPRSSSIRGKDDAHLKALQSLSAHLKLLLDAPEHLWRLLEKKQYLHAAWLFLLARVVHRAMLTEDPEEATWQKEGISVLTQFPLVQRQWDTVAQLRPQIAHRATQHLREPRISSESACSTILTLHLLDSLPLTETLSILLSQRSRTLNTLLSRNLEFRTPSRPGSPIFKSRRKIREDAGMLLNPPSPTPRQARNRKEVVRDVRNAVLELLEVIWGTIGIARDIFRKSDEGLRMSLVERSLEDIQGDSPSDVALTTSTLLSTLPSSTHLLTLPPSILSYRPYMDLTSPSAHVDPSVLDTKLSMWFSNAMEGFQGRLQVWFAGLQSIRELWGMRRKMLESLQTVQGLNDAEKRTVQSVLDNGVQERVGEVASAALEDLEESLDSTLKSVLRDIKEGAGNTQLDITPSTFLFSAPPLPSLLPMSISVDPTATPFKQFKDALRQRIDGRTPLLDRVLGEIESKAREIHENLTVMDEDGQASHGLQDKIIGNYHQAAHASSARLSEILERVMDEELVVPDQEPGHVNVVVFVGRLCYYLSLSCCIRDLCYRDETANAFKETLNGLHARSINCWRDHAISKALTECDLMFVPFSPAPAPAPEEFEWPSQPSPQLINALLSLVSSLDCLGLSRSTLVIKDIISQTLRYFQSAVAQKLFVDNVAWRREEVQLLWDLTFLRQLSCMPSQVSKHAEDALSHKVSNLGERVQSATSADIFLQLQVHIDHSINKYLPRSQTLLAPLLTVPTPRKVPMNGKAEIATTTPKMNATALLPFGPPKADQDFQPAIETVKPSTRFGLLLVGSTTMR